MINEPWECSLTGQGKWDFCKESSRGTLTGESVWAPTVV